MYLLRRDEDYHQIPLATSKLNPPYGRRFDVFSDSGFLDLRLHRIGCGDQLESISELHWLVPVSLFITQNHKTIDSQPIPLGPPEEVQDIDVTPQVRLLKHKFAIR